MVKEDKATWKSNYFMRLTSLLDEYPKIFIVNVDNVGSKQMQNIRAELRGKLIAFMLLRKHCFVILSRNYQREVWILVCLHKISYVFILAIQIKVVCSCTSLLVVRLVTCVWFHVLNKLTALTV